MVRHGRRRGAMLACWGLAVIGVVWAMDPAAAGSGGSVAPGSGTRAAQLK